MKNIIKMIAFFIAFVMLFSFNGCNSKKDNNSGADISNVKGVENNASKKEKVKITKTPAKSVETEKYETADFSITIPKGWQVKTGGANMSFFVAAYDPDEPRNRHTLSAEA